AGADLHVRLEGLAAVGAQGAVELDEVVAGRVAGVVPAQGDEPGGLVDVDLGVVLAAGGRVVVDLLARAPGGAAVVGVHQVDVGVVVTDGGVGEDHVEPAVVRPGAAVGGEVDHHADAAIWLGGDDVRAAAVGRVVEGVDFRRVHQLRRRPVDAVVHRGDVLDE